MPIVKLAGSAELIVWAIVAVVVMVAKGLGKLAAPSEEAESTVAPKPVPRSRTPSRPALTSRRMVQRGVPPVVRPITVAAEPPVMPSTPVAPAEKSKPAAAVPPAPPSRASQWAAALRDQKNVRNVIIANEIIGRPVSLREL